MSTNTKSIAIVKAAEKQTKAQGFLSTLIRECMKTGDFASVREAFILSYVTHGVKGDKVNGKSSTPTDSIRSTIHTVSASLVGTDGYPFEGALGVRKVDGVYTLVDKGPKAHAPKVDWSRMAAKYKTDAQKRAALASFAKALGLEA